MKKYIIELIGTFFLVLIIGLTENPIAIGLGLAVLVYMGAHISGAHYNPCLLYTSPSPRDRTRSRMPSSA